VQSFISKNVKSKNVNIYLQQATTQKKYLSGGYLRHIRHLYSRGLVWQLDKFQKSIQIN